MRQVENHPFGMGGENQDGMKIQTQQRSKHFVAEGWMVALLYMKLESLSFFKTSLAFDSEIRIAERIISLELPWDMCTTSLRTGQ